MRTSQAKELFRQITCEYFPGAEVTFSRQSRVAKPPIPMISIATSNVKRPTHPVYEIIDGYQVASYLTRLSIQLDLFTRGTPILDDDTGQTVAYENTALDDVLAFVDFLNSPYVIDWCNTNDVAIAIDGDARDLTGVVNDNNYEYRAQLNVLFYFTQKAVGHAGVLSEESILYPTGEYDEDGNMIYTTTPPIRGYIGRGSLSESSATTGGESETGGTTGDGISTGGEASEENEGTDAVIINPVPIQTSTGDSHEDLAEAETGYFTEVEITEKEES